MNANTLAEKKEKVSQLNSVLTKSKTVVVVSYSGISVGEISSLRHSLKENGAKLFVEKNTLLKKAVEKDELKELAPVFKGPSAIVISDQEGAGLVQLRDFANTHSENFSIKGGVLNGNYCDEAKIKEYATIGSKENALSVLLSTLTSPLVQIALTFKAYAETIK